MDINVGNNNADINVGNNTLDLEIKSNNVSVEIGSPETNVDGETGVIYQDDHNSLKNRDKENQHPIKAIEGLEEALKKLKVNLDGYATEKWVEDKAYMPVDDFIEYINYFYYDINEINELLDDYYSKEEMDEALKDLPTGGTELTGGDNTVIEDNAINVYTNTGYVVSDKDIKLQPIIDSGTFGTNKIVYTDDEVIVIYDGSKKIRRSENGIDFELIDLPYACKSMFYNPKNKRIYGLTSNGYFIYSDDDGKTWATKQSSYANNMDYVTRGQSHIDGFIVVNKSAKSMINLDQNFYQSSSINSTIIPEFVTQFSQYQHIWCNSTGTFKYGAGTQEGNFASLTNVTVNMLKTINGRQYVGLKNDNKIYTIKNLSGVANNEWLPYDLPDTCTVNDMIFNPYDETYYIFTDINTYYKTKDFISYESVDKDGLRGTQGYFTLAGIQMTTSNNNELLLAPTRTKLENKAQEWDRALNKERWAGNGLEVDGEQIKVKAITPLFSNPNGVGIGIVDEFHLTDNFVESSYVATAEINLNFDPYEIETWFWEFGFPSEENYKATKVVFNQAGSFYDQCTWETEYTVEQYEYGYIYADSQGSLFKYVKLGNLSWLINKGE